VQTLREGSGITRLKSGPQLTERERAEQNRYLASLAGSAEWAELVRRIEPDLFIVLSLFPASALVLRLRFNRPILLLTPFLRRGTKADFARDVESLFLTMTHGVAALFNLISTARPRARRLSDVTGELLGLNELILCPEAFEVPLPDRGPEPGVYHGIAPVDSGRPSERDSGFPWERLDPGKKLLLCSMGSQCYLVGKERLRSFHHAVAEMARDEPGWQLVLASGGQVEAADLPELPADAVVARWVPQLALLGRATAMITHGGLGAVKEAIAHRVPLLVFPFAADQPVNAERIAHHGLGLAGDLDTVTAADLRAMLRQIESEPAFGTNLDRMRERFRETERAEVGVKLVERILAEASLRTAKTA